MKRNDREFDGLFHGFEGLWAAVLMEILNQIEDPKDKVSYEQARRIILEPENGCLPFVAGALEVALDELQRRIILHLKKKHITI